MRLIIVCCTLLLAASFAVTGTPVYDPEVALDGGGDAIPITLGINQIQPNAGCPVLNGLIQCTFDFVNDTSNILTSFTFQTTINTGLSSEAAGSFTCADGGGYFLSCGVHYTSLTGNLRYDFSGVNPPDGDENSDLELNEMEGIPPNGHFIITLLGWAPDATVGGEQLYSDLPHLNNSFTQSPEPAVAFTFGTGLLLLAAMWRRAVR